MNEVHHTTDTPVAAFHEVTVIEGSARRRSWSREEKARIVAESLDAAVSVSAVAHRHGVNPNQLYGWRRQFRREAECRYSVAGEEAAVGDRASMCMARIEIVVGEITVRIGAEIETAALKRVLRVVRSLS